MINNGKRNYNLFEISSAIYLFNIPFCTIKERGLSCILLSIHQNKWWYSSKLLLYSDSLLCNSLVLNSKSPFCSVLASSNFNNEAFLKKLKMIFSCLKNNPFFLINLRVCIMAFSSTKILPNS